jgi:hypothetical protein
MEAVPLFRLPYSLPSNEFHASSELCKSLTVGILPEIAEVFSLKVTAMLFPILCHPEQGVVYNAPPVETRGATT